MGSSRRGWDRLGDRQLAEPFRWEWLTPDERGRFAQALASDMR